MGKYRQNCPAPFRSSISKQYHEQALPDGQSGVSILSLLVTSCRFLLRTVGQLFALILFPLSLARERGLSGSYGRRSVRDDRSRRRERVQAIRRWARTPPTTNGSPHVLQ